MIKPLVAFKSNFKENRPIRNFELTKIDGIPCPYCGDKMFSLSNLDKKLNSLISLSKKYLLAVKYAEYIKEENLSKLNPVFLLEHQLGTNAAIKDIMLPKACTIDHIVPKSEGGMDSIVNYMAACYECNSKRGNTSIYNMINSDKGIKKNIENHVQFLKEMIPLYIKTNKISEKYISYPEMLKDSLNRVSKGELDIKI